MSSNNDQETEELIIKLLRKLERKGKHIQSLLWKLMDKFEDEQLDEKNEENKSNVNNSGITLLYDETDMNVCKVGHKIRPSTRKHLANDPCIICGHRNNANVQNKTIPNRKEILQFLNNYKQQTPITPRQKTAATGSEKQWPLHYAAITGDIVKINELCKHKNVPIDQKRTDFVDTTPISAASRYGQLESIIELIKNGANATPPPDKANRTPYAYAVSNKHKPILLFFQQYIKYLYNFDINDKHTNLECHSCYNYDLYFNKQLINGTMTKYVYCVQCTLVNVKKVQEIQKSNKIIEKRIIQTIRDNPSISVDTLCQMKDVKSLHGILNEVIASGKPQSYWLWLLDIDNFKAINTHLTHAIADTKIQALGAELKQFEPMTWTQWTDSGYDGIKKVWAFRQGGDEFALVIHCNYNKRNSLQTLYETLQTNIHNIKLENMSKMKHVTVSIGVCHAQEIDQYEEMMKRADEVAEMVKRSGKNGIAIYHPRRKKVYKNFTDII